MPPTQRQERINHLLQAEISQILRRDVEDPHIGFVTITSARVTPDLKYAKIFYSTLGTPEESKEASRALRRAKGFIRKNLADRLEMRTVPELDFRRDETPEQAQRIEVLLRKVAQEREEFGEVPLEDELSSHDETSPGHEAPLDDEGGADDE